MPKVVQADDRNARCPRSRPETVCEPFGADRLPVLRCRHLGTDLLVELLRYRPTMPTEDGNAFIDPLLNRAKPEHDREINLDGEDEMNFSADGIDPRVEGIAHLLMPEESIAETFFALRCNARVQDKRGKLHVITGDLFLSTQRLIHLGVVFTEKSLTSVQYASIVNVSIDAGMILCWLNVYTANSFVSFQLTKPIANELQKVLHSNIEILRRNQVGSTSSQPVEQDSSVLSQIEKLGNLWKNGILSTEEFERAKAELLRKL